jgi:heme-degrading monooxygenase HmoA
MKDMAEPELAGPLASTPPPPYYAVIFTSVRSSDDPAGYEAMAGRMAELAAEQPGFLGMESVRDGAGVGMTVSYWDNLDSIRAWGRQADHRVAQSGGRARWYEAFRLRICRVEQERVFQQGERR